MLTNLAISNVPGSPVPLYLAGARVLGFHPLSIITHGVALNITIQTYDGMVDFGIVADRKALPHADDLARAIEAAFTQAQSLMGKPTSASTAAPATPGSRPLPKTRKTLASKTSKSTKLEGSTSSKRDRRPDTDTGSTETKRPITTPSDHGKTVKFTAPAEPVRRTSTRAA